MTTVSSNGKDIVCTSSDETTRIPCEIDTFYNGTGNIWVNVPSISEDSDTDIYIYYGEGNDNTDDNGYRPSGTWNDDFVYVNHMNDVDSDTTKDSSRYNNTPTKRDTGEPSQIQFGVGSGQLFDDSDNTLISSSTISAYELTDEMTIMMTFRYDLTADSYGYLFNLGDGTTYKTISMYLGGSLNAYSNRIWMKTDQNDTSYTTFPTITQHATYYMAFTYQSGAGTGTNGLANYYMSGVLCNSLDGTWSGRLAFGTSSLNIGNRGDVARAYSGAIDEVRFMDKAMNRGWIVACYSTMVATMTLCSFSAEESEPAGGTYTTYETTVGTPTGWSWASGQFDSDQGMRATSASPTTWEWADVSSSTSYFYPSGSPTSWIWASGSS
jgi:hypothetical protein